MEREKKIIAEWKNSNNANERELIDMKKKNADRFKKMFDTHRCVGRYLVIEQDGHVRLIPINDIACRYALVRVILDV